ncbi:unnamed protein product, partial [Rotaria sp. Silwood1]
MRAQDQAQLPPSQSSPPQYPPLPQQQPAVQLQQQLPQATCPICQDDIGPNEPRINCNICHKSCHSGEITQWLTTRLNHGYPVTCPNCRTDMSKPNPKDSFTILHIKLSSLAWALGNQQPPVDHPPAFPVPPHNPNNNTPP